MSIKINEDAADRLKFALRGSLVTLFRDHNWEIFCLDGMDEHDAYEHMRRGNCMLCGERLGEDTLILVDEQGILGIWCGPVCLKDMHVISWLEEVMTEKLARIDPNNKED